MEMMVRHIKEVVAGTFSQSLPWLEVHSLCNKAPMTYAVMRPEIEGNVVP
jgi:hypothetical protein